MTTLGAHHSALVRSVHVERRRVPQVLQLFAAVHSEMRAQELDAKRARIDAQLVPRNEGHVSKIRREAQNHVDAPGLDDLDLPPRRRVGAAAGHHRNGAGVAPQRFARRHAAIAEAKRIRHEHHVAGGDPMQREATAAENRHRLAILRAVEHRTRQAGRAAARLQHERHPLAIFGRDSHEVAERRIARDAVANLGDAVGWDSSQVVERSNRSRSEPRRAPMTLEERNLPAALYRFQEALFLQCAQLVARHLERRPEVIRRRWVVARELIEIERAPIPGDVREIFVGHGLRLKSDSRDVHHRHETRCL